MQNKINNSGNFFKKILDKIVYSIYSFFRKNSRVLVALVFLILVSYPVINKIVEVSKNKVFFDPNASNRRPDLKPLQLDKFNLGVSDTDQDFKKRRDLDFENTFVLWEDNTEQKDIKKGIEKSLNNGRRPIITIEPWQLFGDNDRTHINNIVTGKYDQVIKNTCKAIGLYNEFMIVNWGPEPDLAKGYTRYSWAIENSNLYQQAYQRFHKKCKEESNKIIFMWTANGNEKTKNYYPGDPYVDILGLTIIQTEIKPDKKAEIEKEATNLLNTKLSRVNGINKIVYLMNYGIKSTEEKQKIWIDNTFDNLKDPNYNKIRGLVYFQAESALNSEASTDKTNFKIKNELLPIIIN